MEFLLVVPQWLVEMRTEKLLDNALHKCTCGVEPPLVRWPFPRQTLLEHKLQAICRGPIFMASLPRRFVTGHGRILGFGNCTAGSVFISEFTHHTMKLMFFFCLVSL